MGSRAKRIARVLLLLLLVFQLAPHTLAEEPSQSVLGLYAGWQENGLPAAVEKTYYDSTTARLVVIISAGGEAYAETLLASVTDPENMEIQIADAPAAPDEAELAAQRRRGVLVLGGAYLGAISIALIFILLRGRHTGRSGSKESWLNKIMGGR